MRGVPSVRASGYEGVTKGGCRCDGQGALQGNARGNGVAGSPSRAGTPLDTRGGTLMSIHPAAEVPAGPAAAVLLVRSPAVSHVHFQFGRTGCAQYLRGLTCGHATLRARYHSRICAEVLYTRTLAHTHIIHLNMHA